LSKGCQINVIKSNHRILILSQVSLSCKFKWLSVYVTQMVLKFIKSLFRFCLSLSLLISSVQSKSICLKICSLFVSFCLPALLPDLSIKDPRLGCLKSMSILPRSSSAILVSELLYSLMTVEADWPIALGELFLK